jgi:hypothetical protein
MERVAPLELHAPFIKIIHLPKGIQNTNLTIGRIVTATSRFVIFAWFVFFFTYFLAIHFKKLKRPTYTTSLRFYSARTCARNSPSRICSSPYTTELD